MKKHLNIIWIIQSLFCLPLFSQSFTYHSDAPFGIQSVRNDFTGAAQQFMFFDIDGDLDLDLFLVGLDSVENVDPVEWEHIHFFIEIQENIGDRWNPEFGERVPLSDNFPYPAGYFLPSIGDLNQDNDPDFLVNGVVDFIGNRRMSYIRSTGRSSGVNFEAITGDTVGLKAFVPESLFFPELVDLDGDGDLDILMSGFNPAFADEDGDDVPQYYYGRNTGTKSDPHFQAWHSNPYELMPNPNVEVLTSGDIDNDGDVDLTGAIFLIPDDSISHLFVHLNTPGVNQRPSFGIGMPSPFGLPVAMGEEQFLSPQFEDMDGDGDLDFFVFHLNADTSILRYYENSLCIVETSEMEVSLCEGDAFKLGGNTYTEPGNYTLHLEGSDLCDSIINLTIEVLPLPEVMLNASICEGETYVVGGESFSIEGDYTVFVVAANGCDSIVYLSLTVNENYSTSLDESICEGETYSVGNDVFTVSGNYEIHFTSINGCDSLINLSLTVYETYNINVTEDLCEGDTYTVGNDLFTETGHYEVHLSSVAGCDSLISLDLTFIHVDNTVTANENVLTANQAGASYQWLDCDSGANIPGATGQSYTVTATGNYGVTIIGDAGCTVVSDCQMVVISGLIDEELSNSITIFPNPASEKVHINNTSTHSITGITLTNLSGQVIDVLTLDGNKAIDVSNLISGVYVMKINFGEKVVIKRLIVI